MIAGVKGLTSEQFLQFNEHLLGLVRARVPLDEGLGRMAREIERGRLRTFVSEVAEKLQGGQQLSEVLETYRPHLSDYYVALICAGEAGGSLAEILHHLVGETRRQIDHRRAIVSSLAYPAMVFVLAVAIFAVVCGTLIPSLVEIFKELGRELPTFTLIVVNVAYAIRDHALVVAVVLAAILVIVGVVPQLRPVRDALMLNMPIAGRLVYGDIAISFSRCMGFLLERKVAMTDALALTESVLPNVIARRSMAAVRRGVSEGRPLSDMLDLHGYLPPSTRWMIRLAEERGDLERTLSDIADFYEAKQEQIRRTVRGMVEPVIILGLGLLIGSLIVSLYLPLFTIPKLL